MKPRVTDRYYVLVRQFPLVPIRDERGYDAALAFLKKLAVCDENALDAGQRAYLAALTQFVGDYEEEHHRIETAGLGPLAALKYLMRENQMRPADLGRLLGNRGLASQILSGKRGLSKRHIALLCQRFRVEPGLFFEPARELKKTG